MRKQNRFETDKKLEREGRSATALRAFHGSAFTLFLSCSFENSRHLCQDSMKRLVFSLDKEKYELNGGGRGGFSGSQIKQINLAKVQITAV